jgi:hypothetical protein
MEVADLDSREVKTASFAARLHRLRIAYHSGRITDFVGVSQGLFSALAKSEDPDGFLRDRVAGQYQTREVRAA